MSYSPTTLIVKLKLDNSDTTAYFDDVTLPVSSWGGHYPTFSSTDVGIGQAVVPAYYQSSDHGDIHSDTASDFPDCAGAAPDKWYDWDGCTPISGAMILGYWRDVGYQGISSDEDELIDVNHHYMGTLDPGITVPFGDVYPGNALGLHNAAAHYCYNFNTNGDWTDWAKMQTEFSNNMPFILTMWDVDITNGHSVAAKGYAVDQTQNYIHANDTWDTKNDYYIQYGTWIWGWQTTAIPQNTLTLGTSGQGTITKNPDQETYDYGSPVTITATADTGYHFVNWTGDDISTIANTQSATTTITMNSGYTIVANFEANPLITTLYITGPGDLTNISQVYPSGWTHWQAVAVDDGGISYVREATQSEGTDLYTIESVPSWASFNKVNLCGYAICYGAYG